jgi:hypothetical protein
VSVSNTNNITSKSDLICATSSTPHSWVILKSPEGIVAGHNGSYLGDQSRVWIVFSLETSSVYASSCSRLTIAFHRIKPTGGLTTANPASSTKTERTELQCGDLALNGTSIYHFAITDKGHFWSAITGVRTNELQFIVALFPLTNIKKFGGLDYPYPVAFYQSYLTTGTLSPDLPSEYVLKYYLFSGTNPFYYYGIVPLFGGNAIGNVVGEELDFNGNLVVFPLGIQTTDELGIIGYIADFLFVGSTSLPSQTMTFEGDRCSFGRWLFPVDKMMRA